MNPNDQAIALIRLLDKLEARRVSNLTSNPKGPEILPALCDLGLAREDIESLNSFLLAHLTDSRIDEISELRELNVAILMSWEIDHQDISETIKLVRSALHLTVSIL